MLLDTDECVFCRIAGGLEPAEVIAEGTTWLAFFPLDPATTGHTLVIPRIHTTDYWDTSPAVVRDLGEGCLNVGRAIRKALAPAGMNLITSAGTAAEQTVFHLHIHLVPRWLNDGFGRIWPLSGSHREDTLEDAAERVREAFTALL